jgi:hypothetical protein
MVIYEAVQLQDCRSRSSRVDTSLAETGFYRQDLMQISPLHGDVAARSDSDEGASLVFFKREAVS